MSHCTQVLVVGAGIAGFSVHRFVLELDFSGNRGGHIVARCVKYIPALGVSVGQ